MAYHVAVIQLDNAAFTYDNLHHDSWVEYWGYALYKHSQD